MNELQRTLFEQSEDNKKLRKILEDFMRNGEERKKEGLNEVNKNLSDTIR